MDPFQKLPAELCLILLNDVHSLEDARNATYASPHLMRAWRSFELMERFIKPFSSPSLIQDVLAIELFPNTSPAYPKLRKARIQDHLQAWAAKKLPYPLATPSGDRTVVFALHAAYRNACLLAHGHRPRPSHSPTKTRTDDENRWRAAIPTRFLQEFLQYELLCKVYGKAPTTPTADEPWWTTVTIFDEVTAEVDARLELSVEEIFQTWDWSLLSSYKELENQAEAANADDLKLINILKKTQECHGSSAAEDRQGRRSVPRIGVDGDKIGILRELDLRFGDPERGIFL